MDGQEVLNFLLKKENGNHMVDGTAYLLLLDIRMPRVSGVEVLAKIKAHEELRKIPTVMITTSDNPAEIERCHDLGCSSYISKPIKYEDFIKAVKHLGLFLSIIQVPRIGEPREEETTNAQKGCRRHNNIQIENCRK